MDKLGEKMDGEDFNRALGDALAKFLEGRAIRPAEAARQLGINKQTLMTYLADHSGGKRNKPRAELLFQACTKLGFEFEYEGHRVLSSTARTGEIQQTTTHDQLTFDFGIELHQGTVTLRVRRPPGRITIDFALSAAAK